MVDRRIFLQHLTSCVGAVGLGSTASCALVPGPAHEAAWNEYAALQSRIVEPVFPESEYSILSFGAERNVRTDSTSAIQRAIQICYANGGGRVNIPRGTYITGPIRLQSNVNLHLDDGARLMFDTDPSRYLPLVLTRWQGIQMMGYSPLVYAFRAENIALTGQGILDGCANDQTWWPWKGPWNGRYSDGPETQQAAWQRLNHASVRNIEVSKRKFGSGSYLRPSFIQPYMCKNILIDGISVTQAPFWQIHPILCRNVIVRNVSVRSHGPNNDGCNPDSCSDVHIDNCDFDTGDDCIAIKSGRNADGRRVGVPSQNILVSNCRMQAGHGGVVIGSEMSGGVRNVFVENCRMSSPDLWYALRIKTNSVRGGYVNNVNLRNIDIGTVSRAAVRINFNYENGDIGTFIPSVSDINLTDIDGENVRRVLDMEGYQRSPIRNVSLTNCNFRGVQHDDIVQHVENLTLGNVEVTRANAKSIP